MCKAWTGLICVVRVEIKGGTLCLLHKPHYV